jgi:hypothetical protein
LLASLDSYRNTNIALLELESGRSTILTDALDRKCVAVPD